MLSKPVGTSTFVTVSTATQNVVLSRFDGGVLIKFRVATTQPIALNFGAGSADNTDDILLPANCVEHFSLAPATTSTVSVVRAGSTDAIVSITPVA